MAIDLDDLVAPAHTALVTQEIQRGVVGDLSPLPDLAAAARPILGNIDRLARMARARGIPVIHCTAERRADGRGSNSNARIFQYMARAELKLLPGSDAVQVAEEVAVEASDIVVPRLHGVSPFQGTELDFILRNLAVSTIVGVGVSVNVGMTALAFDAVNSSYQVVIPRDGVAGVPQDYVEAVFANTLGVVATLVSTQQVLDAWSERG